MELLPGYALATSNPISEHRSDGEVTAISNTFKEAMEAPQAVKWKEAADREKASLQKRGVRRRVFGLSFLEGGHRGELVSRSTLPTR